MTVPNFKRARRKRRSIRWPCGSSRSAALILCSIAASMLIVMMVNLQTGVDHEIGESELSMVLRNQRFSHNVVEPSSRKTSSTTNRERILTAPPAAERILTAPAAVQEDAISAVLVQSLQTMTALTSNSTVQEPSMGGLIHDATTGRKEQGIVISSHNEKVLVLRAHQLGLNNQLQCIHIAGVLALQYNRTLVVPPNGYQGSKHANAPIPFYQLFDESSIKVPLRVLKDETEQDLYYAASSTCNTTVTKFVPEYPSTIELTRDPNPDESCLVFDCEWGDLHHATPKELFPQVDELLFPLHPRFRTVAKRVIQAVQEKATNRTHGDLKLLGLHVRRGDTNASPLFDCHATSLFPRLEVFDSPKRIKQWRIMCADGAIDDVISMQKHGLSWPRVLRNFLWECPATWPLCANDFDAVFVASNDLDIIQVHREKRPNVFTLQDFPFVSQDLCSNGVYESGCVAERIKAEEFLVEEMILTLCNVFQPSIPSTVTDVVFHMRLHEEQQHEGVDDKRLYEAHDKHLFEFKHVKKVAQLKKKGLGVSQRMNENNNVAPSLVGKVLRPRDGTTTTTRKLVLNVEKKGEKPLMMECRYLASLLAKHDNRALVLPPDMPDAALLFNEVYDESKVNITIAFSDEQVTNCSDKVPTDGSSEVSCASPSCTDLVDHRDILLGMTQSPIDFVPIYWFLADKIIQYIKIHSRKWNKEDFTILAIHIDDDSENPPQLLSNDTTEVPSFLDSVIHCNNHSSPVLCAKDFDAVFVATANGGKVHPKVLKRIADKTTNVFGPDDFVWIRRHLCKGTNVTTEEPKIAVQEELVYQLAMVQASAFQTYSSTSLRSDIVLQLRRKGRRPSTASLY